MADPNDPRRYATIVVGIDGSPAALHAVDRAGYTAERHDASLIVVCAYHPLSAREQAAITTGQADARMRVTGTEAAQNALDEAVERARQAGAQRVEGVLVPNDAVEALLAVAGERNADLIVIGSRGGNTLSARLLGSVPADLSHRAPCDVLIVRADPLAG